MKGKILLNKNFWLRLSLIVCLLWFGITCILSTLMVNFPWLDSYRGEPSSAFGFFVAGVITILGICNGVPWVCQTLTENSTNSENYEENTWRAKSDKERLEKHPNNDEN